MNSIISCFTVFFEDPFWVGVFECESSGEYGVCRIVFGAEPKDNEIYAYILKHWNKIGTKRIPQSELPTIRRKKAKHPTAERGVGTKAQQALARAREQMKTEKKIHTREQSEEDKRRRFEQKQKKKKEKHRGH